MLGLDEPLEHEGYVGSFTRSTAPGAIPNGARIVKALEEPGDAHKIGDLGTVLGSIGVPESAGKELRIKFPGLKLYGYFVEWDDQPKVAVFVAGPKIGPAP
jgi:hypothetical protein